MREQLKREMLAALEAADSRKADQVTILEMDKDSGAFTDYFILCNGTNPRQMQSIADEIELQVKRQTGTYAHQVEGYREAEWILVDYVDFVVHIFSEERRAFYGLERLWRSAKTVTFAELRNASIGDDEAASSEPDEEAVPAAKTSRKRPKPIGTARSAAKSSMKKSPANKTAKKAVKKAATKKKRKA